MKKRIQRRVDKKNTATNKKHNKNLILSTNDTALILFNIMIAKDNNEKRKRHMLQTS